MQAQLAPTHLPTYPPAGLTWRPVSDIEAVKAVLKEGSRSRATASTAMNSSSSRSHAILCVRLAITSAEGKSSSSALYLVDLAGVGRGTGAINACHASPTVHMRMWAACPARCAHEQPSHATEVDSPVLCLHTASPPHHHQCGAACRPDTPPLTLPPAPALHCTRL